MISMTRLGASKLFADLAREVARKSRLGKLTEVGARHGLKVAV
jgi:hypothetical protein